MPVLIVILCVLPEGCLVKRVQRGGHCSECLRKLILSEHSLTWRNTKLPAVTLKVSVTLYGRAHTQHIHKNSTPHPHTFIHACKRPHLPSRCVMFPRRPGCSHCVIGCSRVPSLWPLFHKQLSEAAMGVSQEPCEDRVDLSPAGVNSGPLPQWCA